MVRMGPTLKRLPSLELQICTVLVALFLNMSSHSDDEDIMQAVECGYLR